MAEITEIRTTESTFKPYVSAEDNRFEFTVRAVVLGAIFGIIFGAVTVYVGLRAGLTVAASIPIAVLSISILRVLGRYVPPFGAPTILENNIVQTTGSAGESVAGGVIFTLPALIFLGYSLDTELVRIFFLALIGGLIGVFFMIPLRRQLIVKEHGNLLYPEGTACADVLIAGDKGGSFASRVFWGLGLGGIYTLFQSENILAAWPSTPTHNFEKMPGASLRANTTSEYMGVGYIIGPKIAGVIFAGGVFSWFVMMPAIKFFGSQLATPIYPGTIPIAQMTPDQLWSTYVRPIGAGAVAAAGLITLLKTVPTIVAALKAGAKDLGKGAAAAGSTLRTDNDLSMKVAMGGAVALLLAMWAFLTLKPVQGAETGIGANLVASIFVLVFGFLFVTVSSRICGLIGTSANPISGMTIATLMATTAVFLALGWTASPYSVLAITIGGVVCVAAANSGNTSQDLKTGFLVGATPKYQQISLVIGVLVSVVIIGYTLIGMNRALETFTPLTRSVDIANLPAGLKVEQERFTRPQFKVTGEGGAETTLNGNDYALLNSLGSAEVPDGKYLYSYNTKQIEVQWTQGIGSAKAAAPQARLMSTVINGILTRKLPWGLVLLGVFLVIAVELLGIRSLAFAVGSYLSIATTLAIFSGGVIRWLVERGTETTGGDHDSEVSPGSLYASGLIAAGGIVGLMGIGIKLIEQKYGLKEGFLSLTLTTNPMVGNIIAVLAFIALGASLYVFAKKPLEGGGVK